MKTFGLTITALLAAAVAGAQSLAPSPTASIGCEPHGDHWHCEGPASATSAAAVTSASATTTPLSSHDHDDDHDHEETGSLAPSPTESVGCEAHGDHWHCDGPASTSGTEVPVSTTESLAPSPTESVGCEPHGDHWHCDGPAATSSGSVTVSPTAEETSSISSVSPISTAGAGNSGFNRALLAGGVLAVIGVTL